MCDCAKGNAPFERGAWECSTYIPNCTPRGCICEATARRNRKADERDTRADLIRSLRVTMGHAARCILADKVQELRRYGMISASEKRDVLAFIGVVTGGRQ